MVQHLGEATRTARKGHRCQVCTVLIKAGDRYHVSTCIYDGRIYDFKTCDACEADGILAEVWHWCGMPDEGVAAEEAHEWAHAEQPPQLVRQARDYLARSGCDCERCEEANS